MNTPATTTPDPLTIAYIALGAHDALSDLPDTQHRKLSDGYGEDGIIGLCIEDAALLDACYTERADEYGDVFNYEVAAPYGRWLIEQMGSGNNPTPEARLAYARLLVAEGCA